MVADKVADMVADKKKVTFMELDVVADKTADMVADKKKVAIMDWRLQGSSFVSLFVDHPHWSKVHSKLFVWESAFSALRILAPVPPHGF